MTGQKYVRLSICLLLVAVLLASFCGGLFVVGVPVEIAQADSSTTPYYNGDYYKSIDTSLRGETFRDKLATLITTTHKNYTSYDGLAEAYKKADVVQGKSGTIKWFYTATEVKFSSFGGSSGQTNREHVWPKDGGAAFSATSGCGSDAHHLRPTETNLNSTRGSKNFGEVEQIAKNIVKENGKSNYGNGTADGLCYTSGDFFYPAAGYRGATARILMYVQTRWGDQNNLKFVDGSGHSKTIGDFKTLMKWHLQEPPTEDEIYRNEAVFQIQGNRNPFIDHPEYAAYIYAESGNYYAKDGSKIANEVNALLDENDPYGDGIGNVEPTKITLDRYQTTLEIGDVTTLVAGAVPANANKSVSWASKDETVVKVDQSGKVTAVGEGQTTVSATSKVDQTKVAYCVVTVTKARTVVEIEVDGTPTKVKYNQGDSFDPSGLTVTVLYDDGNVDDVALSDCEWLDGVTLQTKLSVGTTRVVCRYRGKTAYVDTPVTVVKVESVQKTITLTRQKFSSGDGYNWHNWTVDGVSGSAYIYAGTTNSIQMNSGKGACAIINGTELVGGIKTVTLTLGKNANSSKQFTLYTSDKPFAKASTFSVGSQGTKATSGGSVSWQLSGNDTYFALYYADDGVVYIADVTITYGGGNDEQCEHVAGEWQTEKVATCSENGAEVCKCTKCGIVFDSRVTEKTAHTPSEKWTTTVNPDCTNDGTEVLLCKVCGQQMNSRAISAEGHELAHHSAKSATCTEEGWTEYDDCTKCDYTTKKVIPAKGHSYGAWTTTTQPTPTTDGEKTRTCQDCGFVQREKIPATGGMVEPTPDPDPKPNPEPKPNDDPTTDPDYYPPIGCFGVVSTAGLIGALVVVVPAVFVLAKRKQS